MYKYINNIRQYDAANDEKRYQYYHCQDVNPINIITYQNIRNSDYYYQK